MNELDKKIAELKGIPYREHNKYNYIHELESAATSWSSDAKAFELVDEWKEAAKGNFAWVTTYKNESTATFSRDFTLKRGGIVVSHSSGRTRAEAICLAYIASREWMATKGET